MKSCLDEVIGDDQGVLVFKLTPQSCPMKKGRDFFVEDVIDFAPDECECEYISAEDPLFILYTSGSTGRPKGIIHRAGGYAVAASLTHRFVFDIKPNDVFGCTSDLGWITGHTYVCYGPLLNGVTTLVFAGSPLYPDSTRIWNLISQFSLTHIYTSPSAARAISSKSPDGCPEIEIPTLRVIGSVGETLDDTTWEYLFNQIGRKKCWIVDTYWQTEMGAIIATSIPGYKKMKPGSVGQPLFGTELVFLDSETFEKINSTTEPIPNSKEGLLCIATSWPGLTNACFGNSNFQEYIQDGFFKTGDLAMIDSDGFLKITGRADDQLCVNGHRVGPAEVEAALLEHPNVKEAAVVGIPHPQTGQRIVSLVVLKVPAGEEIVNELKTLVANQFSAIGRPDAIYIVNDLPKTKSEKIVRRLLRSILISGDATVNVALANESCIAEIVQLVQSN